MTPESMPPATRTEDFLAPFMEGWLVFEATDELAKCRLHPIPGLWAEATDEELEQMLHRAEPIRGDRISGPHARVEADASGAMATQKGDGASHGRSFRFPNGRFWNVGEWATSISGPSGGTRTVLRFSAGARSHDLTDWPRDSRTLSDTKLADLLVTSFPRTPKTNPTTFRRRAGD